jgi:phage baseplate assembly protein W
MQSEVCAMVVESYEPRCRIDSERASQSVSWLGFLKRQ